MRNIVRTVVAIGLLLIAGRCAPAPVYPPLAHDPPGRASLLIAALGRRETAADLAWLRLVQLIGDPRYGKARYPAVEQWIALIAELHPRLGGPFFFGVTLLLGDPERRDIVEHLLTVAEQRMPDDFRFPLERGVLAYFGRFDAVVAAEHLERSASKPGAPSFIGSLAATLRRRGLRCSTIAEDAAAVMQGAAVLGDRTVECIKRRIEAASAAARLNDDVDDSVDALIKRGHLPAEILVPGLCWDLKGGNATPRTCASETP